MAIKRELLAKYRGVQSQFDMAKKYQVTQQTWSNWELGKATPDAIIMKRLEIDTGIPMEKIFFDIFNKKNLLKGK